jgi:hypothetical protein
MKSENVTDESGCWLSTSDETSDDVIHDSIIMHDLLVGLSVG